MKKIMRLILSIHEKGFYYRFIATPDKLELKLYRERRQFREESPEHNYCVDNDKDGRLTIFFGLENFLKGIEAGKN